MKLSAFILSLLAGLLPAAALIRGQKLAVLLPVSSVRELLGWALIGSAICLALLAVLFLDAITQHTQVRIIANRPQN